MNKANTTYLTVQMCVSADYMEPSCVNCQSPFTSLSSETPSQDHKGKAGFAVVPSLPDFILEDPTTLGELTSIRGLAAVEFSLSCSCNCLKFSR